mmetsp:Transcript_11226/g.52112  ORF Transcript_11226/g.52112 Transcript_11226/m.52112 type:complete len:226 (+) Transcript_11226:3440-4117(+)
MCDDGSTRGSRRARDARDRCGTYARVHRRSRSSRRVPRGPRGERRRRGRPVLVPGGADGGRERGRRRGRGRLHPDGELDHGRGGIAHERRGAQALGTEQVGQDVRHPHTPATGPVQQAAALPADHVEARRAKVIPAHGDGVRGAARRGGGASHRVGRAGRGAAEDPAVHKVPKDGHHGRQRGDDPVGNRGRSVTNKEDFFDGVEWDRLVAGGTRGHAGHGPTLSI